MQMSNTYTSVGLIFLNETGGVRSSAAASTYI